MKLHLMALVLVALVASTASAQSPGNAPSPEPAKAPPPEPTPFLTIPYTSALTVPNGVFPTARPMFRAPEGIYLFDSGLYMLGGADGVARSSGAFIMGCPAPPNYGPYGYGVYPGSSGWYMTGSIVTAPTAPGRFLRP
jgi:hypothetical protein